MSPSPSKIIWIYSKYYQDYHKDLDQSGLDIEFFSDFDYETIVNQIEKDTDGNHYLLILDDILQLQHNLDIIFTR